MIPKARTLCKLCTANVTFVRFFSCVYSFMALKATTLCKLCRTNVTFVRFFSSVCSFMVPKARTVCKLCSTNVTFVRFFSFLFLFFCFCSYVLWAPDPELTLAHINYTRNAEPSALFSMETVPLIAAVWTSRACWGFQESVEGAV